MKAAFLSLEKDLNDNFVLSLYFTYNGVRLRLKVGEERVVKLIKAEGQYIFEVYSRDDNWEGEILDYVRDLGVRGLADRLQPDYPLPVQDNNTMYNAVAWLSLNAGVLREAGINISQSGLANPYYLGRYDLNRAFL